jgi:2-dehydro-3-deoxyphosphooctonate aldolase (KDO 8-P synthase)
MKTVSIGALSIGNDLPLTLIAGPCQLESKAAALEIAEALKDACAAQGAGFVFKASFDKANRTSGGATRGPGRAAGLEILAAIKADLGVPVLTDVHSTAQCAPVAEVVDVLQIPAFLCRQTDLLQAAGETGAAINLKKGQFLAPWDLPHALTKITETGNDRVMLCERGTSFGYNALVADMRSLPILAQTGHPVIMDATHAVQLPGGAGDSSSGQRQFAPVLARAATSLGIAGLFLETHPNPDQAPSDGPNMIRLADMPDLIRTIMASDRLAKRDPIRL